MTRFCLGILETGRPPEQLIPVHGTSPDMFAALLSPAGPSIGFRTFGVLDGQFPDTVEACDAWLITGSRAGVADDEPWIAPLMTFLAGAHARGVPVVGICFGHQVLAAALGGRVEKSARGWGIGLHRYPVFRTETWMNGRGEERKVTDFAIQAMHEDQIVELPSGATVLAGSAHCPYALVAYGDTAISIQGHPEFTAPYARDLIALRRGMLFSSIQADAAIASVDGPANAGEVARWIVDFLTAAVARRAGS